MNTDEEKERTLHERKLDIARKLVESVDFPKIKGQTRLRKNATVTEKEARYRRTLKLITNPNYQQLYSMSLERKMMTETSLASIITELQSIAKLQSNAKFIITALRESLKRSLFGCEVNVALCGDSSATQLEFIPDESGYIRRVIRGQSICFECIDQNDVVLHVVSKSEIHASKPHITSGDAVVYVPLMGTGGGVGIVEIHGLHNEDMSDSKQYERPLGALRAMINAKDFRFKDTVKLWRLPSSHTGGTIVNESKATGVTMYNVVCGIITLVAFEKNGVPYVGGARYTLCWEDGLVEEAVSAFELMKVYVNTPQSLGCGTALDEHLVDNLLQLGRSAGLILESQRTKDVVSTLRKQIFQPDLTDTDVCEITLDAIGTVINGIRVAHLLAFNPTKNESVSLIIKFPSARTVDRALKNSISDVVRACMQSTNPKDPTIIDDNSNLEWVVIEIPVPTGYTWPREPLLTRFFCALVRYKPMQASAGQSEMRYYCEMIATLADSLGVLFASVLRARHRKDLIKSIEEQLYEWRHFPPEKVCHNALKVASEVLPKPSSMYVGIIQPGGNELTFIASNECSGMVGKKLLRGQGISFEVMESGQAVVLRDSDVDKKKVLVVGATVDVLYGKLHYRAKIVAVRGHELFDVLFDEDKVLETGVSMERIRPVNSAFRTQKFGPFELPFVSIPLRHRTKGIGVLNVDNFRNVPKAPYDLQPEDGLVNFLDKLGRIIGTTLDSQKKKSSLKAFATICRSGTTNINEILNNMLIALKENLYYLSSVIVVQIPTDEIKLNQNNLKQKVFRLSRKQMNGIHVFKAATVFLTDGAVPAEVKAGLNTFDPTKFHLKPVQQKGDNCVWLMCKLRSQDKTVYGKMFIVAINLRIPFNDPDIEYLQILQKILVEGLQGLDVRKARGEVRFEALTEIKSLCRKWNTMDRHTFFAAVMEQVEMCFFTANMYVGKIGMYNNEIRYILASRLSNMKGQVLKRMMADGISFSAVDESTRIFVHQKSTLANSLHHFGPKEQFEYPFVVIPIIGHIDATMAILGVDACDDPISESERHENIISFFGTVASQLSTPIRGYCAQDATMELERIANSASSFHDGIREVKRVILGLLPFASRVAEITYEPKDIVSFRDSIAAVTIDEYIIHVRILDLEALSKTTPAATLECFWNGLSVFKSKFKADADFLPFTLHVAKGIQLSHISFQMVIKNSSSKELCRKSLGFHYFVNTPVYAMEHIFDNASSHINETHLAKVTMVSKMYKHDEFIFYTLSSISAMELPVLEENEEKQLPDPLVKVIWNNVEIGKTSSQMKTISPTWFDIDLTIPLNSKGNTQGSLALEVWDEDPLGRSNFFGRIEITEKRLLDITLHADVAIKASSVSADPNDMTSPSIRGNMVPMSSRTGSSLKPANSHLGGSARSLSKTGSTTKFSKLDKKSGSNLKSARRSFESFPEESGEVGENIVWLPLEKHPTLPPFMQTLIAGTISFQGIVTKAHEMSSQQILDALNVQIIERTATLADNDNVVASMISEMVSSELTIIAGRDIVMKNTYSGIAEPIVNPFIVVSLNNEEVGRTGTILNSINPTWDDEKFIIRFASKDPGSNILQIEVFHLGEHGKAKSLGMITITGNQLMSLLLGTRLRSWWFDLHPPAEITSLEQSFFRGQIRISGRPMKIDVTGQQLDPTPTAKYEMTLLAGANLMFDSKITRYIATVQFNGVMIFQTQAYSEMGTVKWNNENFTFWQTGNIALDHSELLVEFWPLDRTGGRIVDRLALIVLTGDQLKRIFTSTGCVSTWVPVTVAGRREKRGTGMAKPECFIRTGPAGGRDELLEDGPEMFVTVLAGCNLMSRNSGSRANTAAVKANPYCTVKWNGRLIGRTTVSENTLDPIWHKQRFCFRLPVDHAEEDTLETCVLRIDVYDKVDMATEFLPLLAATAAPVKANGVKWDGLSSKHGTIQQDTIMGSITLSGNKLKSFLRSGVIQTTWQVLAKENVSAFQDRMDRASAMSQRAIYGEIKLRGGGIGEPEDTTSVIQDDFKLDIISALGLGQSDAFKKSNPYVVIEWIHKERGRTKVVKDNNSPEFMESFLIRVPPDRKLKDLTLTVSVWCHKEKYQDDFLGCISLTEEKLVEFFHHPPSDKQAFKLDKSHELTEEENAYVQGIIYLNGSVVVTEETSSIVNQETLLVISGAKNLAKCNLYGSCIDCYAVVYYSSRIENGGVERELHRTHIASNSLEPIFNDEHVSVLVPLDDDWSGIMLRIEMWDVSNDFLGCVILEGNHLKALLNRHGNDALESREYPLKLHPALSPDRQRLVQGELVLTGGLKTALDTIQAKSAEEKAQRMTLLNARKTVIYDEAGVHGSIHLHACKKLKKADLLAGKSNPYCKLSWNGKPLGKSEVMHSTLNPKWEAAVFDVKLPAFNNFERCLLEIEVWHFNTIQTDTEEFLGMISLTGAELENVFGTVGNKTLIFPLKENPNLDAKQNRLVAGTIILSGSLDEEQDKGISANAKFSEPMSFELKVVAATNLAMPNLFGRPPDSFVAVYWTDQDKATFKTQVVSGRSNPTYGTTFILDKPDGVPLRKYKLRIAVYNKNTVKDHDFLGQIVFEGDALEIYLTEGDGRLTSYDLQKSNTLSEANQTFVQGSITLGTRPNIGKKTTAVEKKIPPGMKEMEITVLAAVNLPKANMFGLSDPYCIVHWGSAEIGRTSTIKETCDPLWDGDEVFVFQAPIELGKKDKKSARDSKRDSLSLTNVDSPASTANAPSAKAVRESVSSRGTVSSLKASRRQSFLDSTKGKEEELKLIIDVYDWNRVGNGIFLGCLELSGDALTDFAHGERMQRQWFELGRTDRLKSDEQKLVKGTGKLSRIEIMMGPHDEVQDGRDIELVICEAKGLAKVDTFGFADPYVKVRFNNRLIGKTEPIKRTLNPVWDGEIFSIRLPVSLDFVDCILYLEVWDWNLTTQGNFLGSVKIAGHDLQNFVEGTHMHETWFDLQSSEYLPANLQGYVQGKLALKAGFQGSHEVVHLSNMQKFEIGILSASGLMKADTGLFGTTDPYVILKFNSKEIGRTPHVTKTLFPVWENQEFPVDVDVSNHADNELIIEIWNHTLVSKSDCLGIVLLTGDALKEFFNEDLQDPIVRTFDLAPLTQKGDRKTASKNVKGKIEVSFAKKYDEGIATTDGPNFKVCWSEERDVNAGNPTLEIKIIRADDLIIAKSILNTTDPFCVVTWHGHEIGTTAIGKGIKPTWNDENFSMKIDPSAEQDNASLVIEVYDSETLRKGTFLGKIELRFWSIIRLTEGEFTLGLDGGGDKNSVIRGTLTFQLRILYPFWDSVVAHVPIVTRRKVKILSGIDFSKISGEIPNSKCIVSYNGAIKIKTVVCENEVNPVWQGAQCEIIVDAMVASDMHIEVFHVDFIDQKEICIGEVDVPYEYLLRPPLEPFDVFLGPPAKRAPKKYKFGVSGSIHLLVIDADKNQPNHHLAFSASFGRHLASISVDDSMAGRRYLAGSDDAQFDGARLTEEQILWLGTQYDVTTVKTLAAHPEWVTLPLRDIGFRTGIKYNDFHGVIPGHRFALCIQRPATRANISDAFLLEDVEAAIQKCLLQLRRKQIYSELRNQVLEKYRKALNEVIKLEIFDNEFLCNWLIKAVMICFPGCIVNLTRISADQNSLCAKVYETTDKIISELVVIPGQGMDWSLIGRHPPKSIFLRTVQDLASKQFLTTKPLPNSRLPMLYVPFLAGDVSSAFFTVENLDIYKCGIGNALGDEDAVRNWLEEMGSMFGEAMYVGKEKYALSVIEKYYQIWNSSIPGLLHQIILQCMQVLQACRLMEIWSINSDQSIKSIIGKGSDNHKLGGRLLIIKSVFLKPGKRSVLTDFTRRLGMEEEEAEDPDIVVMSDTNSKLSWIIGIRYDGIEQSQLADETPLNPESQEYLNCEPGSVTSNFGVKDITVFIRNDRNIVVSLYEVDKNMNVFQEFCGRVSFQTLQENTLKTNLAPLRKGTSVGSFDAELTLFWPKPDTVAPVVDVAAISRRLRNLTLNVKRAAGLMSLPDSRSDPNAYCEVYWGKKLIGKTAVKKDNVNPVWNQSFTVAYKKQQAPFIIDVYEFGILGRGAFYGSVEIPFEQLCFPSPNELDFPLKHKLGMHASKQKFIGGILTVEYTIDLKEIVADDTDNESVSLSSRQLVAVAKGVEKPANSISNIPRSVFQMENPALQLTLACASDLSKANIFGGSSDPYVVIYSSASKDPIFRTKVIENSLDPIWNETFTINFGLSLIPDTTTIKDFPDIVLEVWDYNRVAKGVFLGQCSLTPFKYFQSKSGDFQLVPSPKLTEKENKLAGGILSVRMKLIDNTSSIGNQKYHFFKPYHCLNSLAFLEVYILRCKELMIVNKFSGKSNPFVKVIWNGKTLETGYVKNNLNPTWNHEKFTLNLSAAGGDIGDLVLQVWEKNFFADGEFMGEARIPVDQILHPKNFNQELKLHNFPGMEQGKISGSIIFKLVVKYQTQRVGLKANDFTEDKLTFPPANSMDIVVARDPEEERKRQLYEKSKYPGLIAKAKEQTEKYFDKPFVRCGLISEVHYGQVMSAAERTEHTVLRTDKADMCCVPTAFTGPSLNSLMLVARYESSKLPRRDIQFLMKICQTMNDGVQISIQRHARMEILRNVIGKISHLQETVKDSPEEFALDSIPILESNLSSPLGLYTLGNDGKSLYNCDRITGRVDMNAPVSDFVKYAANVCRHGLILQCYRGVLSVFDTKWDHFSQMHGISLLEATEELEMVEKVGICKQIAESGAVSEPDGYFVVPMIGENEIFVGILVIQEINKLPSALYKVFKKTSQRAAVAEARKAPNTDLKEKVELVEWYAPEAGLVEILRDVGGLIGSSICHCRMVRAGAEMASFIVGPDTPIMDIVRFWFRQIALALPTVRELAIWGVDLRKNEIAQSIKALKLESDNSSKPNSRFSFLLSFFKRSTKKSKEVAEIISNFELAESSREPPIVAGYFLDEDPNALLSTPVERKRFNSTKGAEKEDRYRRNAIQTVRIHKHIVQHAIEQVETMKLDWVVSPPTGLTIGQSPSLIVNDAESLTSASHSVAQADHDGGSVGENSHMGQSIETNTTSQGSRSARTSIHQVFGVRKAKIHGAIDANFMELVRDECSRCTDTLKKHAFRVATGHVLASVAAAPGAKSVLDDIFDPNYSKRKAEYERDRQLLLLKKFELEGKRREKLRAKKNAILAAQRIANAALRQLHSDDADDLPVERLSDISDEDDLDLISDVNDSGDDEGSGRDKFPSVAHPHHHSAQFSLENLQSRVPTILSTSSRNIIAKQNSSKVNQSLPGTANTSFRSSMLKSNSSMSSPSVKVNTMFQAPLPLSPPPVPEGLPTSSPMNVAVTSTSNSASNSITSQRSREKSVSSKEKSKRSSLAMELSQDDNDNIGSGRAVDEDSLLGGSFEDASSITGGASMEGSQVAASSLASSPSKKKSKKIAFAMDQEVQPSDITSSIGAVSETPKENHMQAELSTRTLEADEPAHRGLCWKYYVSILQHGYGGDTGWGVSGDMVNKFLEEMSGYLDHALQQFVHIRHDKRMQEAADEVTQLLEKKVQRDKRVIAKLDTMDFNLPDTTHDIHSVDMDDRKSMNVPSVDAKVGAIDNSEEHLKQEHHRHKHHHHHDQEPNSHHQHHDQEPNSHHPHHDQEPNSHHPHHQHHDQEPNSHHQHHDQEPNSHHPHHHHHHHGTKDSAAESEDAQIVSDGAPARINIIPPLDLPTANGTPRQNGVSQTPTPNSATGRISNDEQKPTLKPALSSRASTARAPTHRRHASMASSVK